MAAPAAAAPAAPAQVPPEPAVLFRSSPEPAAPFRPSPEPAVPATAAPNPAAPAARAAAVPRPATPAAPSPARASQYPELGLPPAGGHGPVSWVGAHGGAGTTTLAEVVGGSDLGRQWPDPALGEPGQVLLVARTHGTGLRAASRALDALRSGQHPAGVELLAVVLVADAPGHLPFQLLQRVRVLRSVAEVHRVPWVPAWRGEKRSGAVPKAVRVLVELAGTQPDKPGKRERKR
ncbi:MULTISPECIES: DUF6668 family protein [unclassified Streptomyces]|uniref:DUF6668 family protein n=1 Tax=unclassified Streptomyces TaxID=2593676 RepID=UPI002DDC6EB2|nr:MULTISPECIES: DUF6668 family protein [unclassified Streptomyces]